MRQKTRTWALTSLALIALVSEDAVSQVAMNTIKKIEARKEGKFSVIVVKSANIPNFTSFKLSDPYRLIVDFSETELGGARPIQVNDGLVEKVEPSQHGSGTGTISRVVITLAKNATHRFRLSGNDLVIKLEPSSTEETASKAASGSASTGRLSQEEQAGGTEEKAEETEPPGSAIFSDTMPPPGAGAGGRYSGISAAGLTGKNPGGEPFHGPKVLEWVGFEQLSQYSRVFVRTSENPEYRITVPDDTTVVIELPNTTIDKRNNLRFLDTSAFDSVVDMITPFQEQGRVAIEIKLRSASRYRDFREGKFVVIDFPRPAATE